MRMAAIRNGRNAQSGATIMSVIDNDGNVTLCWGETPHLLGFDSWLNRFRRRRPACAMVMAACTSRSATKPSDEQICARADRDACAHAPHLLRRCDVTRGVTASIAFPASSALGVRCRRSALQELFHIACADAWLAIICADCASSITTDTRRYRRREPDRRADERR